MNWNTSSHIRDDVQAARYEEDEECESVPLYEPFPRQSQDIVRDESSCATEVELEILLPKLSFREIRLSAMDFVCNIRMP